MARIPTFLFIGNSNTEGYAQLSDVSAADFRRWTGTTFSTASYPINTTVADVNVWTPKLPFMASASITSKTATVFGASTVTITGYNPGANFHKNQVIYVSTGTGKGQWRRVTANTAVPNTVVTVDSAWSPLPPDGSTVEFWTASHTVSSISGTSLVKDAATGNLPSTYVGKWLLMLSGTQVGIPKRIVTTDSVNTITLESAFTVAPAANDTFVIYDGAGSVDTVATYTSSNASFRSLAFNYDVRPAYTDGYSYPNFKSFPYAGPFVMNIGGQTVNYMPELTWQLRNYHSTPIYCIPLGIGGSLLGPYMQAIGLTSFSWFADGTHNDWHPSSSSDLYSMYVSTILAAASASAIAAGNTLDIRGVFSTLVENDTTVLARANVIEKNMTLLRDTMRAAIVAGGYTTLAAAKIPWVMAGVGPSTTWTYSSTANAALAKIAADDPYSEYVPTTGYTFISDGVHYDAAGQILLGSDFFDGWKTIQTRESDATTLASLRPTLSTLRTKVKRRYERNDVSNDATNTQVDMFINDALREVYNTLGDNAWFLRRMETVTLDASYPNTLNLPRTVSRILRIENSAFPGTALAYKGIGYTDSGRTQITLSDYSGGPYIVHFIANPQDLEQDADAALIPMDYLELVVMLTCKRLTEAAGNMTIAQYYAAESERLWKYVKRDCLRKDRFKNDGLTVIDSYDNWSSGSFPGALGNL